MPERTALASIDGSGRARLSETLPACGDPVILEVIGQAGKTGIDCPLDWPDAFVDFVTAHRSGYEALVPDAWLQDGADR